MMTADVIRALESLPHGGSISRVSLSLLPAWVILQQSMSLTFHTMPLGLDSVWGLAVLFRTELRPQGSQTGKVLRQTIYMQFLNPYRFA